MDGRLISASEMNDRLREAYKTANKIPPDKLTLTTQQALINFTAGSTQLPSSEIISTTKNQTLRFNSIYMFDFIADLHNILND